MKNQSNFSLGQKIQDSEGNTFTITEVIENRHPFQDATITLKGQGGEKEVGSLDLQTFKLLVEN